MDERSNPLPDSLERASRIVSVAPHLRRTFALLPQTVRIDGALPSDGAHIPHSAKQLVKLGLLGCQMRLGALRSIEAGAHDTTSLVLSVGERSLVLDPTDLSRDLRSLVPVLLAGLFDASDTAHVLERLAFQSSSLTTLRSLTSHMLASTDLDKVFYLLLTGLTSGYGLGLNRAALFVRDPATDTFVGRMAIGPHDEAEAHRVWEAIEIDDLDIESLVDDYDRGHFDTRLGDRVASVVLAPTAHPNDEVARALALPLAGRERTGRDIVFRGPATNPALVSLGANKDLVLAKLASRDGVLGLVFADNLYSDTPLHAELLEHIALFADQTALVWENLSLLRRVADLAMIDGLTGLLNRRELDARFERERSRAERANTELSLLVFDVDHFKRVNDERGHEEGDNVLRALGSILRKSTRAHDLVARYGGDELVAVLPDCGPEQASAAAARIGRNALGSGISLSIGVASWPSGCATAAELFRAADTELYRAKREGRGRAYVAGTPIDFSGPPSVR